MDKRVTERELPGEGLSSAAEALNLRASKGLNGAKILVLGVAYKRNVEDIRESPALRIIELLESQGAVVSFHDPYISAIPTTREHAPARLV
jgi:UDP-N-acetyl-D-glucosamine dehydrogenase